MAGPVWFCHGVPGSPRDAGLCGSPVDHAPAILERLGTGASVPEALAATVDARPEAGLLHLVGFSIGAMAALTIAAHRPDRVARVTLISAAAPLGLGHWLPGMAGAPVFRAAQRGGLAPTLMTRAQGAMVRLAPGPMLRLLFAGAHAEERAFVHRPDVRSAILHGLRASYGPERAGYHAMLRHYVSDWSSTLGLVRAPVTLWHCAADRWAPPGMAEALAAALPEATLHLVPGGGHFSCLGRVTLA